MLERVDSHPSEIQDVHLLAQVFAAVSDPTRLRILLYVLDHEAHVSAIVDHVQVSQGRVSSHLHCLRWCGFVISERRGKYTYYRVSDPQIRLLLAVAQTMLHRHGEHLATCSVLQPPASSLTEYMHD